MASKSVGQIAGTVIGAAVGFFAGGNVALGASIGGMIGGMIDPPKGPTVVGPRLDDLSFQSSSLGAPLGRAYGTVAVLGNVVWLEGDKYREVITSEEQGGKGGSSSKTETASYYATFAVSLQKVTDASKTVALRRLWIGSNLVYDAGSDNIESIIASNSQSALFSFYGGSDDQQPNTRWQADKGANAVSGFPGRCYIVIYDLDLEPYSRSLAMAQVKVELVDGDSVPDIDFLDNAQDSLSNKMASAIVGPEKIDYMLFKHDGFDNLIGAEIREYRYGEPDKKITDIDVVLNSGYGFTAPQIMSCQQSSPGAIEGYAIIGLYLWGPPRSQLVMINAGGYTLGDQVYDGVWKYGGTYIFAAKNGESWAASSSNAAPILHFMNANLVGYSSISIKASSIGYSENHVFVVDATASSAITCIVKKLDYSLNLIDTMTLGINGLYAVLQVVGDDEFFVRSGAVVSHYANGSAAPIIIESVLSFLPPYSWSWFSAQNPDYGISLIFNSSPVLHKIYVSHATINQSVAKLRDVVTAECGLAGVSSGDIDLTGLTNSDVRGFRIANAGSIRSSLEMLQAAYPFDVAPSGYKLRFVSRGGTSLATIPEADLGATDSASSLPVLLPSAREMDTQIPYKVSVRYLDPAREYDIGEQYASRPDTGSISERTVELSLVLTGDESVRVADVLNQKDWIERTAFGPFSLPPTWGELEPPDVVTVEHRGQSHQIRLTRAETMPDGRIVCSGVPSSAQSYTSSATAQESLTVGQSLVPLIGSTTGYLLDIPRIRSEQDVPGMSFAMTGLASGWPGGVLLRSDDSGNSWPVVGAMNARARVFTAGAPLASHHGYSIDHGAELTVTPLFGEESLVSVNEDQFYSYANLAAYGADGRWEIIAFRTSTDNTGSYTLNNFLRGLYGTEANSGLHVTGDRMVMLDASTVGFFGLPTSAIGSPRLYRGVTQGAPVSSAADMADTYNAVNLKPLSPVDLRGDRDTSFNWNIYFDRRTRWPVELFSGSATPLGEVLEQYRVEAWDSGYTTRKRILGLVSSPIVSYSSADQIIDFASNQETLYLKIVQVSAVVGDGFPMISSLYRSVNDDPFIGYLVFGCHFNGTNGSTTFVDVKGATINVNGNAQLATDASAFGGISGLFDGTGDYLQVINTAKHQFGSGDFTIDGFATLLSLASVQGIVDKRNGLSANGLSLFFDNTTSKFNFVAGDTNTSAWEVMILSSVVTSATRYHLQISRGGNIYYLFLNGVLQGTATWAGTIAYDTADILFGTVYSSLFLNGKLDDWRITKACRNTASFTPRTSEFTY